LLDLALQDSDDLELMSVHRDRLPHRRQAAKNFLRRIRTEDHHVAAIGDVRFFKISSLFNVKAAHRAIGELNSLGGYADDPIVELVSQVVVKLRAYTL